ncbi:MAG: prepilin-type N-terminal cleavage/methylation domain-containing protein [Cyanobacteria bacterium J06627_8]
MKHRVNVGSFLRTVFKASNTSSLPNRTVKGFTLIELLVVVIISGGIISGLLYLVVELLTADQNEASRTQTQQEMQLALDYISAELREAVYVYDQECMSATANGVATDANFCPGLYNHIPASITPTNDNYPIIAFWKQQLLPDNVRQACDAGTAIATTPCIAGHSYSLVVYTLDTDDNDATWDGLARIRRYALTQFGTNPAVENTGYVDPGAFQQQFRSWPFFRDDTNATPVNQQAALPTGNGDVLVDFVDDRVRDGATSAVCPGDPDNNVATVTDTQPYYLTSDPGIVTGTANSFYACVGNRGQIGENRDVLLFLRGNAHGRPAIRQTANADAFLPTLETQVLSRPVLQKLPGS